ncbi:MAG: NADH-quinone oxidoreductase subunit NuoK [Bacteroidota bacterium]
MDITTYGLYLAAILFCIGLYVMITKKNLIFVLIGVELVLNGAMLNLIVFSSQHGSIQGQIAGVFIVVIAACEAAVALAILLNIYKRYKSSDLPDLNRLGR